MNLEDRLEMLEAEHMVTRLMLCRLIPLLSIPETEVFPLLSGIAAECNAQMARLEMSEPFQQRARQALEDCFSCFGRGLDW